MTAPVKGKPRGRNGGRKPRVNWPRLIRQLEDGAALWEVMGEHDVCQQVIRNYFLRKGYPLSLIRNAKHNMTTQGRP